MKPLNPRARHWALGLTVIVAAVVVGLAVAVRRSRRRLWIDTEGHRIAFAHLFGTPILPSGVAAQVVVMGSLEMFIICLIWIVIVALDAR